MNNLPVHIGSITIDEWDDKLFEAKSISVSVLRLDKIHPVISGNKWFKLQGYLEKALKENKKTIITYGGAWSNHLVAAAAAAKALNLHAAGIVRGERPEKFSDSLLDAQQLGMQLHFLSRSDYREKKIPPLLHSLIAKNEAILIPEGGFGKEGVQGASSIAGFFDKKNYTHVCCAVGTGTMLAGLQLALSQSAVPVTGISVLKNNMAAENAIKKILNEMHCSGEPVMLHDYHFGGYAKYTPVLTRFINECYQHTGIPSDFVYTGKLFYAVHHLVSANYFAAGSKILIIHSGGLQGNRSLKKGTLIF